MHLSRFDVDRENFKDDQDSPEKKYYIQPKKMAKTILKH